MRRYLKSHTAQTPCNPAQVLVERFGGEPDCLKVLTAFCKEVCVCGGAGRGGRWFMLLLLHALLTRRSNSRGFLTTALTPGA